MKREVERLLRRLEGFCAFTDAEREALTAHLLPARTFAAGEDLVHQRRAVEGVFLILDGFACRYKLLRDGRRQIVGVLLPGDICDLRVFLLRRMDHSISALGTVTAAVMPPPAVVDLIHTQPRLARALWWMTTVEDSITREWVVNVGYRNAFERVAHLFCEVYWRLEAVGLTRNNRCRLPMTQMELGDTLALSSVHVNRTLMYMRRAELVKLQGGTLELPNRRALEDAAGFDPLYLHLDGGNPLMVEPGMPPALAAIAEAAGYS